MGAESELYKLDRLELNIDSILHKAVRVNNGGSPKDSIKINFDYLPIGEEEKQLAAVLAITTEGEVEHHVEKIQSLCNELKKLFPYIKSQIDQESFQKFESFVNSIIKSLISQLPPNKAVHQSGDVLNLEILNLPVKILYNASGVRLIGKNNINMSILTTLWGSDGEESSNSLANMSMNKAWHDLVWYYKLVRNRYPEVNSPILEEFWRQYKYTSEQNGFTTVYLDQTLDSNRYKVTQEDPYKEGLIEVNFPTEGTPILVGDENIGIYYSINSSHLPGVEEKSVLALELSTPNLNEFVDRVEEELGILGSMIGNPEFSALSKANFELLIDKIKSLFNDLLDVPEVTNYEPRSMVKIRYSKNRYRVQQEAFHLLDKSNDWYHMVILNYSGYNPSEPEESIQNYQTGVIGSWKELYNLLGNDIEKFPVLGPIVKRIGELNYNF